MIDVKNNRKVFADKNILGINLLNCNAYRGALGIT
jgi:hypothetical protein